MGKSFLWDIGPRVTADAIALGQRADQAQQFANNLMRNSRSTKTTPEIRQFTDRAEKYDIECDATRKIILRIRSKKAAAQQRIEAQETDLEFFGQYAMTNHAYERLQERFAFTDGREAAQLHLNNLLRSSTLQSTTFCKGGEVAHHYNSINSNMRIVIDKKAGTIITVHRISDVASATLSESSPLYATLAKTVKRELLKAGRKWRKVERDMTLEMATLQVEIARLAVNRTRAKGDHVTGVIDRKLAQFMASYDELKKKFDAEKSVWEATERDAAGIIGGVK